MSQGRGGEDIGVMWARGEDIRVRRLMWAGTGRGGEDIGVVWAGGEDVRVGRG